MEEGASATWMGLSPRDSRAVLASPTQLAIRWTPVRCLARSSSFDHWQRQWLKQFLVMQCHPLISPKLCDDLSCQFWWAEQDKNSKMHWLLRETLSRRKKHGCLGFKDLHLFNRARLARKGWRLLLNLESLYAQVLHTKYIPDGNLMNAVEKPGVSYSWRSIS
jgi:hypothetical protein